MPTSLYNFQYVPLTGRLPGKSFVSQTEQAINGLAQYVYDNSTNYEAVKAIAQKAEQDSSSALSTSEEALDKAQTALETVGRAYIKTTSAVDLNDYYDSELLLILSTESTNLPANITGYLTVMSSDTHDYCMQVYIGIDGSVYKRTATISNNTPTFGAWSETPITLSSLQTILANYTTVDASNIGVNAQTDNSTAWGNAIGGGEIVSGEQRLITGGTAYPLSQNVAQNTSNIATNTADIVQNTGGISANSKRISNIEKLLQGNLYDYDTDDDTAYTKTVPSGAMPYAGLEKVGGKTVVWNQLVDTGTTTVSTISGHKYYTLIDGTASIVTSDGSAISIVDDTADMVCDLTLMFGAGNEPSTTADFTAIFGATHYAYNAGTLLSAGVTEVDSYGYNHLNETYMQQHFTYTDGVYEGNVTPFYFNYNDVFNQTWKPNTAYLLSADVQPKENIMRLRWEVHYTDNTTISSNDYNDKTKFGTISITTDPSKTINYIKIALFNGGRLYIKNIIVREANPLQTISIPAEIQALDGYGCSCLGLHNYIDFERKVYVQNVGIIDMGTLDFSAYSSPSSHVFRTLTSSIPNIKRPQSNAYNVNAINPKYKVKSYTLISSSDDGYMAVADGATNRTVFINHAFSDVDSFTSAMSGTYMVYYLDTPIETDISQYLTDDNLIQVESGGTLIFKNQHGDDYQIPVPSEEEYMIDLQEAINNG